MSGSDSDIFDFLFDFGTDISEFSGFSANDPYLSDEEVEENPEPWRIVTLHHRRGTFIYRDEMPPVYPRSNLIATGIGFFTTLWIGLNWYYNPGQISGHFDDIHPELWTDEELGIPPDDEDIYPPGYIPIKDRQT